MTALMKILKQAQTLPPTLQGNTTVSGVKAVIMHMITFLLLTSKILFFVFFIHPNIHRHVYFT